MQERVVAYLGSGGEILIVCAKTCDLLGERCIGVVAFGLLDLVRQALAGAGRVHGEVRSGGGEDGYWQEQDYGDDGKHGAGFLRVTCRVCAAGIR